MPYRTYYFFHIMIYRSPYNNVSNYAMKTSHFRLKFNLYSPTKEVRRDLYFKFEIYNPRWDPLQKSLYGTLYIEYEKLFMKCSSLTRSNELTTDLSVMLDDQH